MELCGAEYEGFPADFKEYMQMELNWSQIPILQLANLTGWVFWRRQDDDPNPSLSYDNFLGSIHDVSTSLKVKQNIRYALSKMILHEALYLCLVQFWAATTTSEGRILLTTRNQTFSLGLTHTIMRRHLCRYRMMSREYMFYGDEESGEEQLGVPARVFLRKSPEITMYPRCQILASWALPVFEHSSHTCVGVLEIVCVFSYSRPSDPFHERILGRMNDSFQEFGLRCFDGCENCESNSGEKDNEEKRRIPAFRELKRVLTLVCKIHVLPLARTWVPCSACNGLMRGQLLSKDVEFCARKAFSLDNSSKSRHLRKGLVSRRALSSPNMLYCLDITQLSIDDYPLVPYARQCKFSGWFTICLQSGHTENEVCVLEFFLPVRSKDHENITLSLILGTMEKNFRTFRLASGQGLGEVLSIEVINFQNGKKINSIQMIQAPKFVKDGGLILLARLDQPLTNAINNSMTVISEEQSYILANNEVLQNGEAKTRLNSFDRPSMDTINNGENFVTAERNVTVVTSSEEGKRKAQDREHKKTTGEFGLRCFKGYNNCESKLASGQDQGEELSGEVVDFQNDKKIHSVEKIQATKFCQDGGLNLQPGQLDQPSTIAINNTMSVVGEVNGEATAQLDSSDRLKMDLLNNWENIVTMVTSSEEGKRETKERKHKKTGVRIEVSSEDILKCSKLSRDQAARNLGVGISTLKRACRDDGIHRWPPRNIKEVSPFPPSPQENKRQISQLNSGLSSNDALAGVPQMMPGSHDANMVTIKAKYENDTIKFRLSLSSRFVELQQEVAKRLSLEARTYNVKYKDEENELILIACDEDLKECISTLRFRGNTSIVVLLELKQPITNLKLDILAPSEVLSLTQLLKADVDVDNRIESSCLKKTENTSTPKAKVRSRPRKKESTSTSRDPSKFEYVEAPLKKTKQTPCHKSLQAEKLFDSKLINQFPEGIQKFISSIKNVEPDGNCGFRVVADLVGYGADGWVQVRKELILELMSQLEDYTTLFSEVGRVEQLLHTLSFFGTHCPAQRDKWMTIPDMGHLIASCYNVVLVHLSR